MADKKGDKPARTEKQPTGPAVGASTPPELPPPPEGAERGVGRVDVTGVVPEDVRVDPDITEGHPGYEESGDSEIIPNERLTKGEGSKGKKAGG